MIQLTPRKVRAIILLVLVVLIHLMLDLIYRPMAYSLGLSDFGLKDSLREKVRSAISYATGFSNINIRMVSGDHYDTAVKVAENAGIITGNEEYDLKEIVMTGD